MQVTLKTIAEQTGVSISTVSRILSKDGRRRSGDTTAETVIKTAKELGYFDKGIFQFSSAKKKCHTIGCTFISDHESFVSPFFAELLAGIREEVKNQENLYELTLLTFNCTEAGFEQSLENAHLDGSIILGRTTRERVNSLKATIPHLVYAGLNRMEDMNQVLCDAKKGIFAVVDHFVETGHMKIGFIGPARAETQLLNEYRYLAYREALEKYNLPFDKNLVADSFLTASDGYQATQKLLSGGNRPTAIVCGNDNLAIGVEKACADSGIRIPEDIAIAGFDNIADAAFLRPSLTTIDVPKRDLGRYAVKLLLDCIESGRTYPIIIGLPSHLIVRESTVRRK